MAAIHAAETAADGGREYYELQQYLIETEEQKKRFDQYMKEAAIPALNRAGVKPVGVFLPQEGLGPVYVLLPAQSAEKLASLTQQLMQDEEYLKKGAEFLNAPATDPSYKRIESSLLVAFKGMPKAETPAKGPGRVFQLRIYESPSVKTNLKKIEMFNDAGEIAIFRRVGLNPVFFGQALIGDKIPNLTYMLGFESQDDMKAAWGKFGKDPDWQRLRKMEEYADKAILSGITNIVLKAAEYSQI